ncbi:MAG TPA: M28 family peptidase [Solirubrobacteraceae bacterium]|nr:M28 family peptidase [Solirubrobacteraceae bacterium]
MLDGRLYRAAFVPLLFALVLAAFSFTDRPRPLGSSLAPDALDGARAFASLQSLGAEFPDRRPGSSGDQRLAGYVARTLSGLGGPGSVGFTVRTRHFQAQTIDGERTLTTVIGQRAGQTGADPVVILAHRDAAARGSQAELSATAVLLELARVFAQSETRRTVILVSTSGGSGGNAGAADFAAHSRGPFDAVIALGDVAGARARKPFVVPFSNGFGSAPVRLQRTVQDVVAQEVGTPPGAPSVVSQLAHLALPLTVGEQGVLNGAGLPAVLVQVSGERGPSAGERVSEARLQAFGRAVLSAVDAVDNGPDLSSSTHVSVLVQRKQIPQWAIRLLVLALMVPPLVAAVDGLARLRRRREPVGRWALWVLSCALPFFVCALFAWALGQVGVIGAAPLAPVPSSALGFSGGAVLAVLLVLALAWLGWPGLVRRLGMGARPSPDAAGVALLLVLAGVTVVVWVANPFTAALLVPALHLWLLVVSPDERRARRRPRRSIVLAVVVCALVPLGALVWVYAHQFGFGLAAVLWNAVLLLASARIGVLGAALWSVAFGCLVAAVLVALSRADPDLPGADGGAPVTVRGPVSYAGPGSLGGTESALRR